MHSTRADPFGLALGSIAAERFPRLRDAMQAAGRDPRDRDAFLLIREVAELLHELRPEAGIGAGVEALVAFVHYAYLFWADGERVTRVSEELLAQVVSDDRTVGPSDRSPPHHSPTVRSADRPTSYVQLPPLRIWATPLAGQPSEPLDGWFAVLSAERLTLLAIFGLSPTREGFTTVELGGPRPGGLQRADGTPLFAPLLTGAAATGLLSLAGEEELLELAWRVEEAQ